MANAAVVDCYAVLVEGFNTLRSNGTRHRGADYRRSTGQPVVAYEECIVTNSDIKSTFLGYCLTATRVRDGKSIGWAHLRAGTRPANGTRLMPGDQVGLVAGWGDNPGESWSGPHIHTTEDDGNDWQHIWSGQNSDPVPDITAAKAGVAGGGMTPISDVKYDWYAITKDAIANMQHLAKRLGLYDGAEDGIAGPKTIKAWQELGKRWGYLPADYSVDGVPHNADKEEPSSYGYFLQKWAQNEAGYGTLEGLIDGLPGALTSKYISLSTASIHRKLDGTPTPVTPPPVPVSPIPTLPPAPEGHFFLPDLGTTQGGFDFQEYFTAGGRHVALKMGGGNSSDSPYVAPRYRDQLDRARAAGITQCIHYWFNGRENNLNPGDQADFFALHSGFRPGDIAAIDIEREDDTDTDPWTPEEAAWYVRRLQDEHYPGVKGLFYLSLSLYSDRDWSELEELGWEPWIASWGDNDGDPNENPEGDEPIWQYTSKETVPGNYTGNPKVYGDTDGNLARHDLFTRLGWVVPPVTPEPDPEPRPNVVRDILIGYLAKQALLHDEVAAQLEAATR